MHYLLTLCTNNHIVVHAAVNKVRVIRLVTDGEAVCHDAEGDDTLEDLDKDATPGQATVQTPATGEDSYACQQY